MLGPISGGLRSHAAPVTVARRPAAMAVALLAQLLATFQLLAAEVHAHTRTVSNGSAAAAAAAAAHELGCHRHRYEPSRYKDVRRVGGGCYKDVLVATPVETSSWSPRDSDAVVIQMVNFNESEPSADAASLRTGPEGKVCPGSITSSARRRHLAYQMEVRATSQMSCRWRPPLGVGTRVSVVLVLATELLAARLVSIPALNTTSLNFTSPCAAQVLGALRASNRSRTPSPTLDSNGPGVIQPLWCGTSAGGGRGASASYVLVFEKMDGDLRDLSASRMMGNLLRDRPCFGRYRAHACAVRHSTRPQPASLASNPY